MNNSLISQQIVGPIPYPAAEFWKRFRGVIHYLELEGRRSRDIRRLEAREGYEGAGSVVYHGLPANGR
jgi:hypothetical protein